MQEVSINELHKLTGHTRATVEKKLNGVPYKDGPKQAKLYDSEVALSRIYLGEKREKDGEDDFIAPAEAARQLTVARKQEIELNMEVTRKERIPLEDIQEVYGEFFGNASGMLKATLGRQMTEEMIRDILANLRAAADKIEEMAK